MKKKLCIILAAAISTSLLAQSASNSTPVTPAPEPAPVVTPASGPTPEPMSMPVVEAPTNAPAKPAAKSTKKKAVKKTAAHKPMPEIKTVPLVPGPAVVSANHVNVRSKAGLVGEVITRMTNGESVTVVDEVHLKNSGPEEPSAWAKILLPYDAHLWIKTSYLDANHTVVAKKLNLRAGPGEAYGVSGTLVKGDVVQAVNTKGDWTEIVAPTNAYAYMAAQYLKQGEEAPAPVVAVAPTPEPTPAPTPMPETPGMAPAPTEAPAVSPSPLDTNAPPVVAEAPTPAPVVEEPPPPRIVQHEGIVRGTFSIQAPTSFELINAENHKTINYLYPPTPSLDLSRYKGLHIIVTGEEGLDERWKNTPVLTIQKIQVID